MELSKISNKITMSTLEISELTGKDHKHVKRDCVNMFRELDLEAPQFRESLKMPSGQQAEVYNLDKRLTEILVTGYSVKLRAAVIDRLHELESGNELFTDDPFIIMRLNQIKIEKRLDRIEEVTEVLAIEEKRPLTKEEPPNGFANKGDVMKTVSGILGTTKSIVEQVLYFYEEAIETSQYAIEAMSADAIIKVDVKCYRVTEVLKAVIDALDKSKEVTACFSVFPTLGQKKLKVK